MNKVFLSLFYFCLTSSLWAQAIDCKQDISCFTQAASKCSRAQVTISKSQETAELSYVVKYQALIHGFNGTKCLYEDLVQTLRVEVPTAYKMNLQNQGWTETIIQGQALSLARGMDLEKGLVRECEFTTDELMDLIQEYFRENKFNKDKWAKCKKRTINTELPQNNQAKLNQKQSVEEEEEYEEEEYEEEDEDEDVDTTLPEYLEFPHYFNAISFLQNSAAEISPLLAKKRNRPTPKKVLTQIANEKEDLKDEKQITPTEVEPFLIFKSTSGQYIPPPASVATPLPNRYVSPYETPQKSFSDMSQNERLRMLIHRKETPAGKTRLYPQMSYEEMVKAGYTNDEIGDFVFKRIKEEKEALMKMAACSDGCPKGTYCQQMLKRCVQCSGSSDCSGSQVCLNYRCVSNDTVLQPTKKQQ